jgi:hypothetical protein
MTDFKMAHASNKQVRISSAAYRILGGKMTSQPETGIMCSLKMAIVIAGTV